VDEIYLAQDNVHFQVAEMCFGNRQGLEYLELLNVYQCSIENIVRRLRGCELSGGILSGKGCFLDLETVGCWADAGSNF